MSARTSKLTKLRAAPDGVRDPIHQYEPLWGEWYIDSLIGEGGFGKVYRIKKEALGSEYYSALKFISAPYGKVNDDSIREVNLMNRLRGHSNIVSIEDFTIVRKSDGTGCDIFIRMELLVSLTEYISKYGLSQTEIICLVIDVCSSLERCHELGIIHADIKPSNIFVSDHGSFKLGDFGASRLFGAPTCAGLRKGTLSYIAPEVYRGQEQDHRADQYSLGILLYRLLNGGCDPFVPQDVNATGQEREFALIKRMRGDPLPQISAADEILNSIIKRAVSHNRERRYDSPAVMSRDLKQYAMLSSGKVSRGEALFSCLQVNINGELIERRNDAEEDDGRFDGDETVILDGDGKQENREGVKKGGYIAGERPYNTPELVVFADTDSMSRKTAVTAALVIGFGVALTVIIAGILSIMSGIF